MKRLATAVTLCALTFRAQGADPPPGAVHTSTPLGFDKAPPEALLTIGGKTLTKRDFLLEVQRQKALAAAQKPPVQLAQLQTQHDAERRRRIDAVNAKVSSMQAPVIVGKPCPTPKIDGILAVPPVEPGEYFALLGCGFGSVARDVFIELPEGSRRLQPIAWKDNLIQVKVPDALTGVRDHNGAALRVVVDGVKKSNGWPVDFRAARQVLSLRQADVVVTCDARPSDRCNNPTDSGPWVGHHIYSDADTGVDRLSASVKNGWVFYDTQVHSGPAYFADPPPFYTAILSGLQQGSTTANLAVLWVYAGRGGISYAVDVLIEGPAGIPYR